jgi:hypothetical protein
MPKFDFYPSFNAGEVSPFIDARTSLEKYRSACRTLENFQILPYGGVIRRPGTQYLGTTKSATSQTRLIGFNFSTTTRFIIEMGVGYMRFWNPATGALQTNTSGGTLEISHPYVGAHLREIQFSQINDIMYFAHANYPPYKLSRLADDNWTFAEVAWDFPPQLQRNSTDTTISSSSNQGTVTLTASDPIFKSGHVNTRWDLKWKRLTAFTEYTINAVGVSKSLDTIGAWDFSTSGLWAATLRLMRIPNEVWKKGPIKKSFTRSGTTATISHTDHGYQTGDFVHIVSGSPLATTIPYSITVTNDNAYTISVENSGGTSGTAEIENLSQMEVVREYDVDADKNILASGNEADRCGLKIWISAHTNPIANGQEVKFTLLPSTSGLKSSDTYTVKAVSGNTFQIQNLNNTVVSVANNGIYAGETAVIIQSGVVSVSLLILSSLSDGTFTYTLDTKARAFLSNSNYSTGGIVKINSVATNGLTASATVVEWLGADSLGNKKTTLWTEPGFSGQTGYPRSVAMHEQRLCYGGTSSQPNTIWCSAIDDFENFQTGATAADAVQFTLAASEGNRINWMYSQSQLLIGTSGDEWTIGSADSSQALSATNVQASRQSSYGSKYMRAALVNDVLLFVQRNGRKVRELVYELNKDGWVAPDLTLLAEHITNGEIVEVAYQQQPDAVLWCVRGDGTLIAMTYERDQKVVGWHRHTLGDADVESVATIYGNGTEDEVWMVVKRYVGIVAGQKVQFTNLPAGSNISATETYVVLSNPSGNKFTIGSLIGESLSIANSSITANTTQVVVVNGSCSAPISNLSNGVFSYIGGASATLRTVERFPLLWRKHIDDQTAKDYRYLDGHFNFPSGALTPLTGPFEPGDPTSARTVSVPAHFNGKTVTIVQGTSVTTQLVTTFLGDTSITLYSTAAGYVGLPYTSTLRPMKLDADFEDGTAQSRKKRIHQVVVRTLKSRGGEVRTNSGSWYALAPTTTTGDQKIILGGAFGIDADVDVRQTEPYPMCIISILPKWDAYGNE